MQTAAHNFVQCVLATAVYSFNNSRFRLQLNLKIDKFTILLAPNLYKRNSSFMNTIIIRGYLQRIAQGLIYTVNMCKLQINNLMLIHEHIKD